MQRSADPSTSLNSDTFKKDVLVAAMGLMIYILVAGRKLLLTSLRPIDDHELVQWHLENPSGNLPYAVATGFSRTFGEFNSPRFRPLFHPSRTVLTALFGPDPTIHYFIRISAATIVILATSLIIRRFSRVLFRKAFYVRLSFFFGLASILAVFEWEDLVARIGTQEPFGLLGFSLAGLAVSTRRNHSTTLLLFGVILMTGFKENFAVHAFLICVLHVLLQRKTAFTFAPILSFLVASFGLSMVGLSLLSAGGRDYYGKDRGVASLIGDTISGINSARVILTATLLIAIGILIPTYLRNNYRFIAVIIFIILVVESAFYGSEIDSFGRYACVSNIVIVVLVNVLLLVLFRRCDDRWDFAIRNNLRRSFYPVIGGLSFIMILSSFTSLESASASAREDGEQWRTLIGDLGEEVERLEYEQVLVVLDLSRPEHLRRWERSHALTIFLRDKLTPDVRVFFALDNLRAPLEVAAKITPIRESLASRGLEGSTSYGLKGRPLHWVTPLRKLSASEPLYCIFYSTSGVENRFTEKCEETVRFSPGE
jgi:hypothetical protein